MIEKAVYAARCAARRVNWNVSPADLEDMTQEAAIAIWKNMDRGENYAFVCGINAALKWWRVFVMGWHRNDRPITETPQGASIPFSFIQNEEGEGIIDELPSTSEQEPGQPLADEIIQLLAEIFAVEESTASAVRDARIVAMVIAGHTNEGIAKSMGIRPCSIKRYRSNIRRMMEAQNEPDL